MVLIILYLHLKKISQLSIIKNYINILEEIENNDIVIFNFHNLYYYSNIELMLLFSHCFEKFYIFFSKSLKSDVVIFKNYININDNILKTFHYLNNKLNNTCYIKHFGFHINNDIIKFIKNYNLNYMNYYIDLNNKILNLNLLNYENNI